MMLNRRQREILEKKPKRPPPIDDMRCGEHGELGCLVCWDKIIRSKRGRD